MSKYSIELIGEIIDPDNDNLDILVKFENGEEYIGTFLTYKNLESLIVKYKQTGECLNGRYFWASDMILIESLDEVTIREVINDILTNKCFELAFSPANDKAMKSRNRD